VFIDGMLSATFYTTTAYEEGFFARPQAPSGFTIFGDVVYASNVTFQVPTFKELSPSPGIFSIAQAYDSPLLITPDGFDDLWTGSGMYV
jgi:hypothetical protein